MLSNLLKAPEATVESAPPAMQEAEGAASHSHAPPVESDLLKAPEAAVESVPPSSPEAEGAASPSPARSVAPPPKAASDSGSPLSVLVSRAPNASHRLRGHFPADHQVLTDAVALHGHSVVSDLNPSVTVCAEID